MKLIDAVRSIQTKPYIAVVLATNKDIQEITTHILRTCSVSEYCVRSVYNSILYAHIALVCLKEGSVDLVELVAWYTAGRFEYLVEGFENIEVDIPTECGVLNGVRYEDYMYHNVLRQELIYEYMTHYNAERLQNDARLVYESIIILNGEKHDQTVHKSFDH